MNGTERTRTSDRVALLVMSGRRKFGLSRGPRLAWGTPPGITGQFHASQGSDRSLRRCGRRRRRYWQAQGHAAVAQRRPRSIGRRSSNREAPGRVVDFDQIDNAELEARCAERLRQDHGVPSDRTTAVLLEFRAAVATAKSDKSDAEACKRGNSGRLVKTLRGHSVLHRCAPNGAITLWVQVPSGQWSVWPGSWRAAWLGNWLRRSPATKAALGGRANRRAVTCVKPEQASKGKSWTPTRPVNGEGSTVWGSSRQMHPDRSSG